MDGMERIKNAMEEYKEANGVAYEKILVSEEFYEHLHRKSAEKASEHTVKKVASTIIDFRGLEIVRDVDFDFKLLP